MKTEANLEELLGIVFSADYIYETGPERSPVRIPVADVLSCTSGFGSISERPRLQLVIGLLLLGAPLYGALTLHFFMDGISKTGGKVLIALGFILFIGAWLIYDVLKKQPYLLVTTKERSHKLRMLRKPGADELALLRETAQKNSGIFIQV